MFEKQTHQFGISTDSGELGSCAPIQFLAFLQRLVIYCLCVWYGSTTIHTDTGAALERYL